MFYPAAETTAAKLQFPANLSPLPRGYNAQKFTSTHPVRLLGVVVRHGGKLTFYLVELRAARTGLTVKRSVRLCLCLFSLSLSREGAGDLGSIRARLFYYDAALLSSLYQCARSTGWLATDCSTQETGLG